MGGGAQDLRHEGFWRPVLDEQSATPVVPTAADRCGRCGGEIIAGARFCHMCGTGRSIAAERTSLSQRLNVRRFSRALGLPLGALIALLIGVACLLAAVTVGMMYTATTVLDWQAIQAWRIQWLLAATAAFVAGLLLRPSKG